MSTDTNTEIIAAMTDRDIGAGTITEGMIGAVGWNGVTITKCVFAAKFAAADVSPRTAGLVGASITPRLGIRLRTMADLHDRPLHSRR